jgi:hypothetical protein
VYDDDPARPSRARAGAQGHVARLPSADMAVTAGPDTKRAVCLAKQQAKARQQPPSARRSAAAACACAAARHGHATRPRARGPTCQFLLGRDLGLV